MCEAIFESFYRKNSIKLLTNIKIPKKNVNTRLSILRSCPKIVVIQTTVYIFEAIELILTGVFEFYLKKRYRVEMYKKVKISV